MGQKEAGQFDVIVVGGGAAGLMCAAVAGQRGRKVLLLEHNAQVGRKILISGGGRCNFTNLNCKPENFTSVNPHFAKSALALYSPRTCLELVDQYKIRWHEKAPGQLFCDHSARSIVDMLLAECAKGGVEVAVHAHEIAVEHAAGAFNVECSLGSFCAEALVVATGGLSIPKMGATGLGYALARQFGLRIVPTRPALVPLLLGGEEAAWCALAGVAADVTAETEFGGKRVSFSDKMLFTHRGLSGPSILQASTYWMEGDAVRVDLAPGVLVTERLTKHGSTKNEQALRQSLREAFPQRLASAIAERHLPEGWSNSALAAYERSLHRWTFHPTGTEGFEKAEVTAGGVDTTELQARTMEARKVSGLFFIGEVVDVTGWLGGFNFQWAWASGVAAGNAA